MHALKITKTKALFGIIAVLAFVIINYNLWAISHAENNSDWDWNSNWTECGGLYVSSENNGAQFSFENEMVTIKEGRVKLKNKDQDIATSTRVVIDKDAQNVEVGFDGVNIKTNNCAFNIINDSQDVHIVLLNGSVNSLVSGLSYAGIHKGSGNGSLYIDIEHLLESSNGSLTVKGGEKSAGIGGGSEGLANNIIIAGGTVTAIGGKDGAGIGGGYSGSVGNITITGGRVNATGGENAAGIGGGGYESANNITITGGEVTATGGKNASGIGGGNGAKNTRGIGSGFVNKAIIRGGTVTAIGGVNGAGIGGGYKGMACHIEISGGTVTATGGEKAVGIGGGIDGETRVIIISGGSINTSSFGQQPVNEKQNKVYLFVTQNPDAKDIFINDSSQRYNCPNKHSEVDSNLYLYLPGGYKFCSDQLYVRLGYKWATHEKHYCLTDSRYNYWHEVGNRQCDVNGFSNHFFKQNDVCPSPNNTKCDPYGDGEFTVDIYKGKSFFTRGVKACKSNEGSIFDFVNFTPAYWTNGYDVAALEDIVISSESLISQESESLRSTFTHSKYFFTDSDYEYWIEDPHFYLSRNSELSFQVDNFSTGDDCDISGDFYFKLINKENRNDVLKVKYSKPCMNVWETMGLSDYNIRNKPVTLILESSGQGKIDKFLAERGDETSLYNAICSGKYELQLFSMLLDTE